MVKKLVFSLLAILTCLSIGAWIWTQREVGPGTAPFDGKVWRAARRAQRYGPRMAMAKSARNLATTCPNRQCVEQLFGMPERTIDEPVSHLEWLGDSKEGYVGKPPSGRCYVMEYDLEPTTFFTDVAYFLRVYVDKSDAVRGTAISLG